MAFFTYVKNQLPAFVSPVCLMIFCCLFSVSKSTSADSIAIKAGHVIFPESNLVRDRQVLAIDKGKIVDIGSSIDTNRFDVTVDLSHYWVMAGMMDCHVHLTRNDDYRRQSRAQTYVMQSTSYRTLIGARNAKLLLNAGFTTVKEIGNDGDYITAGLIRAINERLTEGPTIIYAGRIIAPYGGQSAGISPAYAGFWDVEYIDADTPDEIRKAVRQNVYFGANSIKLVTDKPRIIFKTNVPPGLENDSYPYLKQTFPYYDVEDIRAAVDEAAKVGAKVTVHAIGGTPAKNVILGGAAGIEHGLLLDDELLELMKNKGVFLCGTELTYKNWYAYGGTEEGAKEMTEIVVDRLRRADRIGVKMAFGTDVIIDIEGMNRVESNFEILKAWTAAKVSPNKLLQAMTSNAAELLGVERERGFLKKGYFADIVAFERNPLLDIENVRSVSFVMKEGSIVRNDSAQLK